MKITVAGLGYVGLSNAILLSRQHEVTAIDITAARVADVNAGRSPIVDAECSDYLASGALNLRATVDPHTAYAGAEIVIIATPTNYDAETHAFDTSSIESVIAAVTAINPDALMVIKSTVPVGYVASLKARTGCANILFSPEFLREGRALYDNLHPSRIVVGEVSARGERIAEMFRAAAIKTDVPVLLTHSTEAEAIKLFANTYLALRVTFFNELDTIAMADGLDAREMIETLCADPRVGDHYNNPSFGYGGYCLPKDSKQLLANFGSVPQQMMRAIVEGNDARKAALARAILARQPRRVGVHRLVMKQGSDNFRQSAVQDIIALLDDAGVEMVVYEPAWTEDTALGHRVERDLRSFGDACDVIIANRMTPDLVPFGPKVFTRDLFGQN
ncbi:MAG: nucleotide sugar dehydrogenase [Rhodobacter sp.]|uniref:nucleotide sugar dehydrogenase n=1 Tax=Pararhodobacter sp. TaxID=2127056 RepID=UPI001D368F75|nr:nucleotide sugar dehydrogenase [Pararhodobacter sp.]MCB1344794.1 nucleotide sugar dehydrogenase [Paracoccaceae bacterium]MCC0072646.1 nucleotide sugar dehydrogenase [Rhodobacter sp.]HPD93282.1 nucleotide sugar dehydrogenase [Pararhodobacter sp.]